MSEINAIATNNYILHNIDAKKLYVQEPLFTANSGDAVYVGWRPDETVLWEGVYSGNVTSTNYITLSEPVSAFERVRIINGGNYKSCYEYDGMSDTWSYLQTFAANTATVCYCLRFNLTENGTKVTCSNANFFKTFNNGVSEWNNQTRREVGENTLTKVIGINRKENA